MKDHTDQKACIESPLEVMERLTRTFNAMSDLERAVYFDMLKREREREKLESTSTVTAFSEPAGAGDVRGEPTDETLESLASACGFYGARKAAVAYAREVLKLVAPSQPAAPAVDVAVAQGERAAFEKSAETYPYDLTWTKFGHYAKRETQYAFLMFKAGANLAAPLPCASDAQATAAHAGAFEGPVSIHRTHPNQAYVTFGFDSEEQCTQFIKATRCGSSSAPTPSATAPAALTHEQTATLFVALGHFKATGSVKCAESIQSILATQRAIVLVAAAMAQQPQGSNT